MNRIKNIILSVFVLVGFSMPSSAQTDIKAMTTALAQTIKEFSNYADSLAYRIALANSKNPDVMLGIAEAYNMNMNYDKTKQYAMKALKLQRDFAPSYILLGRQCEYRYKHFEGNEAYRDTAIMYYQKAIEVNPLYPDSYDYYAALESETHPDSVLQVYLQLKETRPDLPIDATIAGIQYAIAKKDTTDNKINLLKEAISSYEIVSYDQMTTEQLRGFCGLLETTATVDKDNDAKTSYREKLLDVANFGHKQDASDPGFNRYRMNALNKLERYEEALQAADDLFNKSDTAKTHFRYYPFDYEALASADFSLGKYHEGVDNIQKGIDLGMQQIDDMSIPYAVRTGIASSVGDLKKVTGRVVEAFTQRGNYEAAAEIQRYAMEQKDSASIYDLISLSQVYISQMNEQKDSLEKQITLNKILDLFQRIEREFPLDSNVPQVYYLHGVMIWQNVDTGGNPKSGRAVQIFEHLLKLEDTNMLKTTSDETYISQAAQYLAIHYFYNDKYQTAMKYAQIMMNYDATYGTGQQIYDICKKYAKPTAKRRR